MVSRAHGELASRWEAALAEVKQIEARLAEAETRKPGPTDAERQRLLELGEDLEALATCSVCRPINFGRRACEYDATNFPRIR